jgi:uncharacterized protein (TIGR02594 family)
MEEGDMVGRRIMLGLVAAAVVAVASSQANATPRHHRHHHATAHHVAKHHHKHRRQVATYRRRHHAYRVAALNPSGGVAYAHSDLVNIARKYIGTNPTHRRSLWCGAFMDMVLEQAGYKGGGNLAKGYLRYGHRVPPEVGAIAVMGRRGGGHVGVVSGFDANGNPIIISGNHNRTTAEAVYPRARIIAYVAPS